MKEWLFERVVEHFFTHHIVEIEDMEPTLRSIREAVELSFEAERVIEKATQPHERPRGEPAVPIEESVQRDYIVCLEDGMKLKMLKRHLTQLGMTPEQYRHRWGLPDTYPMVAPSYARERSEIAIARGLGKRAA